VYKTDIYSFQFFKIQLGGGSKPHIAITIYTGGILPQLLFRAPMKKKAIVM